MDDSLIRLPDIQFPEGFPKDTPLYVHEEEGHAAGKCVQAFGRIIENSLKYDMELFYEVQFENGQMGQISSKKLRLRSQCPVFLKKADGNKIPGIILGSYNMPVTSSAYKEENSEAEKIWYSIQLLTDLNSCIVEHEVTLDQLELRLDENRTTEEKTNQKEVCMARKTIEDTAPIPTSISIVEEKNLTVDDQQQTIIAHNQVISSPSPAIEAESLDSDVLSVEEVPNKRNDDKTNDAVLKSKSVETTQTQIISKESSKKSDLKSPTRKRQRSHSPTKKPPQDNESDQNQKKQVLHQGLPNDIEGRIPRKHCGRSISPSPLRQDRRTDREKHDSPNQLQLQDKERLKDRKEGERQSKSLKRVVDNLKTKELRKSEIDRIYDAPYQYSVTIKGFDEHDYIRYVVGSKGMFHKKLLRDSGVRWIRLVSKPKSEPFVLVADFNEKLVQDASEDIVRWIEKKAESKLRSKITRYN